MSDDSNNNLHMELLQKIADQVQETQDCVNKLDKKLDLNIQKTEFELQNIHKTNEQQNVSLEKHMARSDNLELLVQSHKQEVDIRLSSVEAPMKWSKTTVKILAAVGTVAGALWAIIKLLGV